MALDISGQVALVTGASRGIGRYCALELAGKGCKLALTARDESKLAAVAKECMEAGAQAAEIFPADLKRLEKVESVVKGTADALGGLNILVNNAGVFHHGYSDSASLDQWDEMLDINLRSVMQLTRAALPHILAGAATIGRGAVIFIASMSGKRTYSGGAGYCATKFGVVGFASALWDDIADKNVKVSAICPGWVNTDMADGSGLDVTKMIQPEDIAQLAGMVAAWPDTSCPREILVSPQGHIPAGIAE